MGDIKTSYSPKNKPLMVYDGDCGFCKYWLVKWKKISGGAFDFQPYQSVAAEFKDVPEENFKTAVQLILTNGVIYSGAKAAYYTYYVNKKLPFLFSFYKKSSWFRNLSDKIYYWIAKNRSRAYDLTKLVFGSDPNQNSTPRVVLLLISVILIIALPFFFL